MRGEKPLPPPDHGGSRCFLFHLGIIPGLHMLPRCRFTPWVPQYRFPAGSAIPHLYLRFVDSPELFFINQPSLSFRL